MVWGNVILFLMIWFDQFIFDQTRSSYEIDSNYRCAKYEVHVDNSRIVGLAPDIKPSFTAYRYYIQYGKEDIVVQIIDPDITQNIPLLIVKWDYWDCLARSEFYVRNSKLYYTSSEPISFSIDDKRGNLKPLCSKDIFVSECDSVRIALHNSEEEYLLYFNERIPNIRSWDLFYGDVPFLPSKIVKAGKRPRIWNLDKVFYGKVVIDSILSGFSYPDFDLIPEEEMIRGRIEYTLEEINKHIPPEKD